MNVSSSARDQFQDALQETISDLDDDHAASRGLLTNFVIVCEMMGDDGKPWMFVVDSDQPVWRTQGLLLSAQQLLQTAGIPRVDED